MNTSKHYFASCSREFATGPTITQAITNLKKKTAHWPEICRNRTLEIRSVPGRYLVRRPYQVCAPQPGDCWRPDMRGSELLARASLLDI